MQNTAAEAGKHSYSFVYQRGSMSDRPSNSGKGSLSFLCFRLHHVVCRHSFSINRTSVLLQSWTYIIRRIRSHSDNQRVDPGAAPGVAGFDYADLFKPQRLKHLSDLFDRELSREIPSCSPHGMRIGAIPTTNNSYRPRQRLAPKH
jgi:hypothetical protein